ncbi:MAG: hypothetical protein WKF71_11775 [Pyrinomonadaceae bacterium]
MFLPPTASIAVRRRQPKLDSVFYQRNFQAPLINQYDLILERQIAKNTVVSASYIGSLGRNLPTFVDQNLIRFRAAYEQLLRLTAVDCSTDKRLHFRNSVRVSRNSGALREIQSSVKSEYNALVLQANRRFTDGLQFQASYTLAKSTDTDQNFVDIYSNQHAA